MLIFVAKFRNLLAITTWYAGVATTLRMGKGFFFQPELLYSERGAKLRQSYVGAQMLRWLVDMAISVSPY